MWVPFLFETGREEQALPLRLELLIFVDTGEHSCVTTIAEKHYLKTNKKGSAEWLSLLFWVG